MDNWAEIADYLGTKTSNECEIHYYTFYYKSATDKTPDLNDVIAERAADGEVNISKKKQQQAAEEVADYMTKKKEQEEEEETKKLEEHKKIKKNKGHSNNNKS